MQLKKYILYLIIIITGFSCTVDNECRTSKTANLNLLFYKIGTDSVTNAKTTTTLTIDSISIQGLEYDSISQLLFLNDSILYNNSKKVSSVVLPLNKFRTESKFVVKLNTTIDTLTIYHTNNEQYISLDCGCLMTHTIDTIITTNHFIDSVRINNHDVTNTTTKHLFIYN